MYYVYILRCCDGSFYTGYTHDLAQRMQEHHNPTNYSSYTATRLPVQLIWSQSFPNKWQALKVERQLKGWSRKKKIAMMNGNWDLVKWLSKNSDYSW